MIIFEGKKRQPTKMNKGDSLNNLKIGSLHFWKQIILKLTILFSSCFIKQFLYPCDSLNNLKIGSPNFWKQIIMLFLCLGGRGHVVFISLSTYMRLDKLNAPHIERRSTECWILPWTEKLEPG